jgi:hypothetical protein
MQRTKLVGSEIASPTSAGAASSIGAASCVRICNDTGNSIVVSISTSVGAATTNTFTVPANTVEFLEKSPTDVIWSASALKVTKVALTN